MFQVKTRVKSKSPIYNQWHEWKPKIMKMNSNKSQEELNDILKIEYYKCMETSEYIYKI